MKQEQIVIRGINPELVRKLKVRVAEDQETIKGYVLGLLKRELRLPVDFEVEAQDVQSGNGGVGRNPHAKTKTVGRRPEDKAKLAHANQQGTSGLPVQGTREQKESKVQAGGGTLKRDTCPYHRDQVLVQSAKKTYRAECPQCHEDFEKRAGFSYEVA